MAKNKSGNDNVMPEKAKKPAIFSSEYTNQIITMETGRIDRSPNGNGGKKGKRLKFIHGKYQTSDPAEIKFLKEKAKNPTTFCKIKCVQEPKF